MKLLSTIFILLVAIIALTLGELSNENSSKSSPTGVTVTQTGGFAGVHKTVSLDLKSGKTATGKKIDKKLLNHLEDHIKSDEFKELPEHSVYTPDHEVADAFIYEAVFHFKGHKQIKNIYWNELASNKTPICEPLQQLASKYATNIPPPTTDDGPKVDKKKKNKDVQTPDVEHDTPSQ
ncbi:hypothetical protein DFA_05789 [Cavenderia fasciculata]|uniref:Uncharacterized protein n=1 Tax=Cavenderia fasciculata TaxID=261658 RepID=F4PMK8_CACFS|nr:uncharacterized protein DFA_05789 [Cavenderia fasciculata]EGG23655.1 hypothetical protein DFA_05789 [Cavenderia fasciculata]|eukprot:XP_004361506.1 hypothetical protein DFA_05789 [Cavenderia fasciculata]